MSPLERLQTEIESNVTQIMLRSAIDEAIDQILRMPPKGVPAAMLTDRDKIAIAIAAGCRFETRVEGGRFHVDVTEPFGIHDDGRGGYIVGRYAQQKAHPLAMDHIGIKPRPEA